MAERPRFFDDLAGVAGGAFSALAGMRDEVESTIRARVDEAIRKLDLVKREDLEAVQEMAAAARTGQEGMEKRVQALEVDMLRTRLATVEATLAKLVAAQGGAHEGPVKDGALGGGATGAMGSATQHGAADGPTGGTEHGTPL